MNNEAVGEDEARAIAAGIAVPTLDATLLWNAVVTVAPRQALGRGPLGPRWIIPITGGAFVGGPAHPELRGRVLAGGADRQLQRDDGVRELHAVYEMQVHDGTVLSIDNRVLIDEGLSPRYVMSHLRVSAPQGAFGWLARRIVAGTLQPLAPQRAAVLIRAFVLNPGGPLAFGVRSD
jgi:hypothetical protein